MSRIGKKPIDVPSGVEIEIKPGLVKVKGPKGELTQVISQDMTVKADDGVSPSNAPPIVVRIVRFTDLPAALSPT